MKSGNKFGAIIVAAGKGMRLGTELPKQFLEIGGKPMLMHAAYTFFNFDRSIEIVMVLPDDSRDLWLSLCEKHGFDIPHKVALGGDTRFQSVKNGLSAITHCDIVAVHDAARPFVSVELIKRCYDKVAECNAGVIPFIDEINSVRYLDNNRMVTLNRNLLKIIQSPQVFPVEKLKKAYQQSFNPIFTDDASVLESIGQEIFFVDGDVKNIKVTTSTDLEFADFQFSKR